MEGVVIENDSPTLDDVNKNLLKKINSWITSTGELEVVVELANVIAKLNASSRNNNLIAPALSENEQLDKDIADLWGGLAEAKVE